MEDAAPIPQRPLSDKTPLTELEKLELDRVRLDVELKELQKSLQDTLEMNDGLLVDLKVKDDFLLKQDAYLHVLCEKNAAEEEQLDMEHAAVVERYGHEFEAGEKTVQRLLMHRDRYRHIVEENDELALALDDLRARMADEGLQHALTIHEMNKAMGTFRKTLEKNLKQKLALIEEAYQSQAFLSLGEREKKEIFENTKLKDEVSLQGVGLANLSLRLGRQKASIAQCAAEKRTFDRKASNLRDHLNDLQLTKMSRTRIKAQLTGELAALRASQAKAQRQLDSLPPVHELQRDLQCCAQDTRAERRQTSMWNRRGDMFSSLQAEIKPVSQPERDGFFSAATFTFDHDDAAAQSVAAAAAAAGSVSFDDGQQSLRTSGAGSQAAAADDAANTVKLSVVNAALVRDPLLAEALAPLKGRESLCIAEAEQPGGGEKSINLAGWLVHKIIKIWRETEAQVGEEEEEEPRLDGISGAGSSLLSRLNTAQSFASLPENSIAEGPEGMEEWKGEEEGGAAEDKPEDEREPFLRFSASPVRALPSLSSPLTDLDEHSASGTGTDLYGEKIESREEIEQLWDLAFLAPGDDGPLPWYRKVPLAKRLPDGISVSNKGKADRGLFSHDAIRPARLDYDVGPPIAFANKPSPKSLASSTGSKSVGALRLVPGLGATLVAHSRKGGHAASASALALPDSKRAGALDALTQRESVMFSSSGLRLQRVTSAPSFKSKGGLK